MDKTKLNSHSKFTPLAFLLLLSTYFYKGVDGSGGSGKWQLLLNSTGVVAMHMALTHHNTVVMFDGMTSGISGYKLRRRYNGTRCEDTRNDLKDSSCYAHSVEYDLLKNRIRALNIETDSLYSSGSILSNGTLMQTGGSGSGSRRIHYFESCGNGHCDWREEKNLLSDERLYASSLKLPEKDDRVVVAGGRSVFSYEFVPKRESEEKSIDLPFLEKTYERDVGENNLYPIIHLSSDGNLFIFANRDSILFDYKQNRVVKTFPRIPGKGSRSYPSTGASVILPLSHTDKFRKTEVLICGGGAQKAYAAAEKGKFLNGLKNCGRMVITGHKHEWKMEKMPGPRLMHDMIILPMGHILIINGARKGCAGSNHASHPSLQPYLYKPKKSGGKRFSILKHTKISRMHHSSAILLPDGRVLVAGSNPNDEYVFKNVHHPTELRLQAFVPTHMEKKFDHKRPHNVTIYYGGDVQGVSYGQEFGVKFFLKTKNTKKARDEVVFTAYAPPFNTHSISMNQRMLILKCKEMVRGENGLVRALLEAPPSAKVAPSGYYMLSVVNDGIPSIAQWIRFLHV